MDAGCRSAADVAAQTTNELLRANFAVSIMDEETCNLLHTESWEPLNPRLVSYSSNYQNFRIYPEPDPDPNVLRLATAIPGARKIGIGLITVPDESVNALMDFAETYAFILADSAAEAELNGKEVAADTAAQAAIDAILPTLSEDERYIYSQRVRRLDRMYRDPRYEWALLQDNEQYAIFTDDEWYAMDDAEVGRALGEDTFTFEFTADDNRTVYKWRDVELETLPDVSKRIEGQPSEILRTRREMVGMSITELANRAGITRTALSRLENGHTSLYRADATTVRNLADALGTSISILLPMR